MTDQVEKLAQYLYENGISEAFYAALSEQDTPALEPERIIARAAIAAMDHLVAEGQRCDAMTPQEAAKVREMLERIVSASDYYGKEPTDHDALTLAYAHQSTRNLAIAALDTLRAISEDSHE